MRRSLLLHSRDVVGQVVLAVPGEVWAHCPRCLNWFVVEDPQLETLLLCPDDLHRADETQLRLPA